MPTTELAKEVHADLSVIKVQLATLLERQESIAHRVKNVDMKTEAFVPRREIEASFAAMAAERSAIGARLGKVEENQNKFVWAILGQALTLIGGAAAVLRFKGGG